MKKVIKYLAKELMAWIFLPAIFLYFYIVQYHNTASIIFDHLYVVFLLAIFSILCKVILYRLIDIEAVAGIFSSLLSVFLLGILSAYYYLVLLGLKSWGRIITEELVVSYAAQARQLCEAVGIDFNLLLFLTILCYLSVAGIFYGVCKKYIQLPTLGALPVSASLINIFLFFALLLNVSLFERYLSTSGASSKEPFRLTLFSGKPSAFKKTSHRLNFDAVLDRQEEAARESYRVATDSDKKNVVLIVVDALRPDHMGVYGYGRQTTPYLSSLLAQGVLQKINSVHASCGESACGLASLATSRYTHQLPNNPFTLQQVLQRNGYEIHMILGGDHTNFYNLREIYGKVDSYYDGSMAKGYYMNDDRLVVDRAKTLPQWNGRPVMFQFHLMSAHLLGKRLDEFKKFNPYQSYAGKTEGASSQEFTNFYDNGVFQSDAIIHELLDLLRVKKYLDQSVIVITADHGEGLGEHQLLSHGNSVREELLHIPLLLGSTGGGIAMRGNFLSSQVDIAPTILQALGIAIPQNWQGQPIQSYSLSGSGNIFSFFQMNADAGLYDHRDPDRQWKYWNNAYTNEEFAFDIGKNPKETSNEIWKIPFSLKQEWRTAVNSLRNH